jgi:flagellar FliJ protein
LQQNAKFRLQKVLEVRELIEKERQKELSQAMRKLQVAESQLHELDDRKRQAAQTINQLAKIEVTEFSHHHLYLASLRNTIVEKHREINGIKIDAEKKRLALLEATKNRKALENLKDKHRRAHEQVLIKFEQASIDEVAIRMSCAKQNIG